jgi:phosphoglycolate phosphatase-like HAD superfamily hydrolase
MICSLFDIDGTMIGLTYAHNDSFRHASHKVYGVEASMLDIVPDGMTDMSITQEVLSRKGLDIGTIDSRIFRLFDDMAVQYSELIRDQQKYPLEVLGGVHELLQALKPNARLGIVTGNAMPIAEIKLKATGLWDYFDFGYFGSQKPKRSQLLGMASYRARMEGCSPVFYFADTPQDVMHAKEAGIPAISVATGPYQANAFGAQRPLKVFENLKDTDAVLGVIRKYLTDKPSR